MKPPSAGLPLLALSALCLSDVAVAQDAVHAPAIAGPNVNISVDDCLDAELGALLNKLNIEALVFSPRVLEWMLETRPEVSVSCEGDVLSIRVVDPQSGKFLEQRIDVDEAVSAAMSRYVAVVVAELIEAGEEELAPPAPDPDISGARHAVPSLPSAPSEPEPESTPSSVLRLTIAPVLWLGGSPMWLSYGGSLGLEASLLEWLAPTLDLEGSYGRGEVSVGDVDALQLSGAPLMLFRFPMERISLMAGLGFRMGAVIWYGKPDRGEPAVGEKEALPWHGPCADLRATFSVNGKVELGLNAQGGWYSYEAHALVNEAREMSLEGGWLRLGLIGKVTLK